MENKKCIVQISDNGGGVDESIISKVFEPYFTTKHKSQGTGIGLYMSHQIVVEHMKGNIYMENKEFIKNNSSFKGCRVTLEIPIQEESEIEYNIYHI